jgi:hypothetical protein
MHVERSLNANLTMYPSLAQSLYVVMCDHYMSLMTYQKGNICPIRDLDIPLVTWFDSSRVKPTASMEISRLLQFRLRDSTYVRHVSWSRRGQSADEVAGPACDRAAANLCQCGCRSFTFFPLWGFREQAWPGASLQVGHPVKRADDRI